MSATVEAMLPSTFSMRSAYGRAASAAAWARRSFDAATICMALVIFCVALVEARRTRMSLRLAIGLSSRHSALPPPLAGGGWGGGKAGRRKTGERKSKSPLPARKTRRPPPQAGEVTNERLCVASSSGERVGVGFDDAFELGLGGAGKIAGLANVFQDVAVLGADEGQQAFFERAHAVDREAIQIAVDA